MNNTQTADAAKRDVYNIVTDLTIEQLEKGKIPWQQSWIPGGIPQNLVSKRPYRGINVWLLASLGYSENYFLTWKQIKELGCSVKKGQEGHIVTFWNFMENESEGKENGTEQSNGKKSAPCLMYYKVFNVAQCNDIPEMHIPPVKKEPYPIQACEKIVSNMPQCPTIRHKENKVYYNPVTDVVNMPKKENFKSDGGYFSSLLHELVHSTGHFSRLNRSTLIQMSEIGAEPFSHEELVAEIATCYLESFAGIVPNESERDTFDIEGWINRLRADKRIILSASSQAQKAIDFVLNIKWEEKEEEGQREEAQV